MAGSRAAESGLAATTTRKDLVPPFGAPRAG
jgi:hypothetical protein